MAGDHACTAAGQIHRGISSSPAIKLHCIVLFDKRGGRLKHRRQMCPSLRPLAGSRRGPSGLIGLFRHAISTAMNLPDTGLPNHFELLATDGAARTGRLTTPHGVVRTPAFMPVGTAGAMKGMHWREVREAGADIVLGNTYHLMLRPGAERIAALGGLQTVHRLERADADGFRRLPGDVAVGPAQGQRARRHLPLAYRRRQGRAVAGALDRGAALPRLGHRHADGRMRAAAGRAGRHRAGDAAVAALGRAQQARLRERARRLHAVRHRAGRRRAAASSRQRRRPGRRSASTAMRSAALPSASRRR